MKKIIMISLLLMIFVGCTKEGPSNEMTINEDTSKKAPTSVTYESENGPLDLPTTPERIVILDSSAAGSILMFGGSVVGHEVWTAGNKLFQPYLVNSTEVAADSVEQILALNPDLIITSSNDENYEELSQIAPTVAFTYGRLNYLDTIIEYGKVINQEEKAREWVKTFKAKAQNSGQKIKSQYGEDVSVSVIESYGEEMYLYGDNWGRGTQILYQEMALTMPEAVSEVALTDGYYSISAEVVPEYAADLMIYTFFEGSNQAFKTTETWQNIEAVRNGLILEIPAESFYMTGPISLDYQLSEIEKFFIK